MPSDFKSLYTLDQRRAESDRVQAKYPDRIPVRFIDSYRSYYELL